MYIKNHNGQTRRRNAPTWDASINDINGNSPQWTGDCQSLPTGNPILCRATFSSITFVIRSFPFYVSEPSMNWKSCSDYCKMRLQRGLCQTSVAPETLNGGSYLSMDLTLEDSGRQQSRVPRNTSDVQLVTPSSRLRRAHNHLSTSGVVLEHPSTNTDYLSQWGWDRGLERSTYQCKIIFPAYTFGRQQYFL